MWRKAPGSIAVCVIFLGCDGQSSVSHVSDAALDGAQQPCLGALRECAATWERNAANRLESLQSDPAALQDFLAAMPKGGDLHNHLTGAVYAEKFLEWARADGNCIVNATSTAIHATMCGGTSSAVPTSGMFYDDVVRAWSMQDFVAGAETGRAHFFATFAKFGLVAGLHRNDEIADVAQRAADEHELYVETMFNLGKNVGALAMSVWSGTLTAADLPGLHERLLANPSFASELANDLNVVNSATQGYRAVLGCDSAAPPAACEVEVRFVAQVSRTGANDLIFGQLLSAFEMARQTPGLVAVNLSSPEDEPRSLSNYRLHMAMLDFLHAQYIVPGLSPLHITLHAGELTRAFLPEGSVDDTFHIREAVETGHAERIGHGIDIASEADSAALLDAMAARNVLVEVCLSSNAQILEVSGDAHPLSLYLEHGVPVALATDDQGVSRSSMALEYVRAVRDQHVNYRQLKTMARQSLEHAFLPGDSLWSSLGNVEMVAACTPLAEIASAACQQFLETSQRASLQWRLEQRLLAFERAL